VARFIVKQSGESRHAKRREGKDGLRLPAFLRPGKKVFMDKYAMVKMSQREEGKKANVRSR